MAKATKPKTYIEDWRNTRGISTEETANLLGLTTTFLENFKDRVKTQLEKKEITKAEHKNLLSNYDAEAEAATYYRQVESRKYPMNDAIFNGLLELTGLDEARVRDKGKRCSAYGTVRTKRNGQKKKIPNAKPPKAATPKPVEQPVQEEVSAPLQIAPVTSLNNLLSHSKPQENILEPLAKEAAYRTLQRLIGTGQLPTQTRAHILEIWAGEFRYLFSRDENTSCELLQNYVLPNGAKVRRGVPA